MEWLTAHVGLMMASQSTNIPIIDFSVLRQQLDEDDIDLLREIIEDFRQQRVELLVQVQDAWGRGDLASVAEAAHKLKGSLLTLGAQAAAGAANEVESLGRGGDGGKVPAAIARLQTALTELDPALDDLAARGLKGR